MSRQFVDNLRMLDFAPDSLGDRFVLLTSQRFDADLTPAEVFALEDAYKLRADAVYFRHFNDNRPPSPQIYLYDNTDGSLSNDAIAVIHRDLWSSCHVPMFIEIRDAEFAVFDARKPVTVSASGQIKTESISGKIQIVSEAVRLYSRKQFDSGIFWESEKAKDHFREDTSPYGDLIENLKKVRQDFYKTANISQKIANKLLVFSILIKYLEERGNEDGRPLAKEFFAQLGAENLCGVLRQSGKIIDLSRELSRHFNGKIFEWSIEEEKEIATADLGQLANFLDGDSNLETGQFFFEWRKYSFNRLPVELISSVYEELLNERKDAVYTPEFLVNTLIDQSMPHKEYTKLSVKTIDVSCGSGIFLVSAFKRLAQRHRYARFKQTGKLPTLKSKQLLKIIKDNIFGVDIEEDAVRLAVFSLCLALCDELTPMEIWTELKFDDTFQTNFKADNFFDYLEADKDILGTFDLVIGNPPFKSLSLKDEGNGDYFGYYNEKNSAGIITRKSVRLSKEIFLNNKQKIYPDGQLALMFLDQLPLLLKRGGLLCLIMPSAPLLYNNSTELRRHFFPKYQVLQILDFTNLDAVLFEADVPTAAIFVRKQSHNKEKPITHITFRRTKCVEEKIFFEIDKYDFHYTSQQSALDDKHVWKCNLLGGGRLNGSIARLSHNRTVGDFIEEKKWRVGEGYISSSNRNFDEADYITGKPYLPAKAFAEDGFDKDQISIEHAKFFERPRVKELFSPPLMLIKENIGKNKREIPIGFSDEYLTFRSTIIGISASETQDKASLLSFYNNFKKYNDVLRFFISATSNQFLVTRGTLLYKQDLMNLPYPEDKVEMKLSFIEQILCDDILDYFIEIKSKSKNTKMSRDAKSAHLEGFGEVFAKMLNSIYGKSGKVFSLRRGFDWGNFFITEFSYGESPVPFEIEKIEEPVESLQSLIETNYGGSAYLTKVLKLYEPNKIYLVKPKTLRYWLRSIAIKDADEVFSDLIKAGY